MAKTPVDKQQKQALVAKKSALKGTAKVAKKVQTSTSFHRPKTLKLARAPKYVRKAVPKLPTTAFAIIKHPLATEVT